MIFLGMFFAVILNLLDIYISNEWEQSFFNKNGTFLTFILIFIISLGSWISVFLLIKNIIINLRK